MSRWLTYAFSGTSDGSPVPLSTFALPACPGEGTLIKVPCFSQGSFFILSYSGTSRYFGGAPIIPPVPAARVLSSLRGFSSVTGYVFFKL